MLIHLSFYTTCLPRTGQFLLEVINIKGEWSQLDQIILSSSLTDTTSQMQLIPGSARIFSPSFLLIKDKTWRGERPFRTYYGFKYEGGYSDHLPLIVDFLLLK